MPDQTIEIRQDMEADEYGDFGSYMSVFWAEGHGYNTRQFIRAVVEHCLDEHDEVPAIDADDAPTAMWQHDRQVEDGVIYERRLAGGGEKLDAERPVTVLDLERRRRGSPRCSVRGCREPWSIGQSAQVRVDLDDTKGPDGRWLAVDMRFCRAHREHLPEPHYRVCLVPVDATIVLPKPEPAAVSSAVPGEPTEGGARDA